jgi:RimJ/RimL family protein N-acetyltransferase
MTTPESLDEQNYHFRAARPEDAETLVSIFNQAQSARSDNTIPPYIADDAAVGRTSKLISSETTWSRLVLEDDNIVGYVLGLPEKNKKTNEVIPNTEHLDLLMVRPDQWGKGIGGELLDWAKTEMFERDVQRIVLWTEASNTRSRALYERKGYVLNGIERDHPKSGEPQVQYQLELQ